MSFMGMSHSLIVAADVATKAAASELAASLKGIQGISSFKLGFQLGLDGLRSSVDRIQRAFGAAGFIYDHQKGGTDTPHTGSKFAQKVQSAGCTAAILFPFTGPESQEVWTKACQDAGLRVIVGGFMTHKKFLLSEGGYIADQMPMRIYELAWKTGVKDFVVPGNKLDYVKFVRARLITELGEGKFDLFAPGFIDQGGDVAAALEVAGPNFHPIVGGAIYNKPTSKAKKAAALAITQVLGYNLSKTPAH